MPKFIDRLLSPSRKSPLTAVETLQLKTLNGFIWVSGIATIITRIGLFFLGNPGRPSLYLGSSIYIIGLAVILLIERFLPYLVISILFDLFVTEAIMCGDTVLQLVHGESLVFFIVPIAIAGLLIHPWAGYLVAALVSMGVSIVIIYLRLGIPNIPAFLLFFMIALIIQQSTSRLQKAMEVEQKKSRELQESEAKYHRLIDLIPIGVLIYQDGKIVMANPTLLDYAGASSVEDINRKTLTDFIHPDSRTLALRNAEAAIYQGQTTELVEETFYRVDGSVFHAETSRTPFIFNGRPALLIMINDIGERKKYNQAIALKNRRIQEMAKKLMDVQEQERHLLAAELHDDLGQSLTSLKLMLELGSRARTSVNRQRRFIEARGLVVELMDKVRNLSLDLRPAVLDDFGLFAALRWLYDRIETQTGIVIHCDYDVNNDLRFDTHVETAAFRIIQEALTNITRHASVREAWVTISTGENLDIEVTDQGTGFDIDEVTRNKTSSTGLSGMQERARLLGGSVEILSEPEAGTRVIAQIPISRGAP